MGGAQPEPPTSNWNDDAGLDLDLGAVPSLDAGTRDASASVDASSAGSDAAVPLSELVTDSSGSPVGATGNNSNFGSLLSTYPGVTVPSTILDAGVVDFGSDTDASP